MGIIGVTMFSWLAFNIPEWYLKIIFSVFSIFLFGYAYGFFLLSFRSIKGYRILIRKHSLILPFTENGIKIEIFFDDIIKIQESEDYEGKVIEIHSKSKKGYIELEQKWMRKKEFESLSRILINKIKN